MNILGERAQIKPQRKMKSVNSLHQNTGDVVKATDFWALLQRYCTTVSRCEDCEDSFQVAPVRQWFSRLLSKRQLFFLKVEKRILPSFCYSCPQRGDRENSSAVSYLDYEYFFFFDNKGDMHTFPPTNYTHPSTYDLLYFGCALSVSPKGSWLEAWSSM